MEKVRVEFVNKILDKHGNIIKEFEIEDQAYLECVYDLNDGTFIVAYSSYDFYSGNKSDSKLVKYNKEGDILWETTISCGDFWNQSTVDSIEPNDENAQQLVEYPCSFASVIKSEPLRLYFVGSSSPVDARAFMPFEPEGLPTSNLTELPFTSTKE